MTELRENRLRELRDERGWSQEELASEASTSRSMISRIERFNVYPRSLIRKSIAEALGVKEIEIWPTPTHEGVLTVSEDPVEFKWSGWKEVGGG